MFKKSVISLILVIVILAVILAVLIHNFLNLFNEYYVGFPSAIKQPLKKLEQIVNSGDLDDLTLTIYYTSPKSEQEPMSIDGLIEYIDMYGDEPDDSIYRVDVKGDELKDRIDLLKTICVTPLEIEYPHESMDVRIYYELRLNDEALLKVALWSSEIKYPYERDVDYSNIVVNDVEVDSDYEYNSKGLYDLIMPFLREEDANELESYIKGR